MSDEVSTLFVPIKYNWDYLPSIKGIYSPHSESNHNHVPRSEEMPLLIDFLERREEGALLVSGKRGVGKTSTVILALRTIIARNIESQEHPERRYAKRLLPVFVNAPSFDIRRKSKEGEESDDQIDLIEFKRVVLQNLVRRLFQEAMKAGIIDDPLLWSGNIYKSWFRPSKIRPFYPYRRSVRRRSHSSFIYDENEPYNRAIRMKLSLLYRKAIATEFKEEDKLDELKKEQESIERIRTTKIDITHQFLISSLVSFIFATTLSIKGYSDTLANIIAHYLNIEPEVMSKLLPILISFVPPLTLSISSELKKSSLHTSEEE